MGTKALVKKNLNFYIKFKKKPSIISRESKLATGTINCFLLNLFYLGTIARCSLTLRPW